MVKMGLKTLEPAEKWSHAPKKKWIYNYLADDDGGEEDVRQEVKREVCKRPADALSRHPNHHHQHHQHHHHHHHHHSNNHGGVGSPPPAPRPSPTSPVLPREDLVHQQQQQQRRPPGLSAGGVAVRGVLVAGPQQQQQQQVSAGGVGGGHHTSPRPSLSYPGSPASSPPQLTVAPRGGAPSPLGLVSAFRQDSSSPPTSSCSSTAESPSLPQRPPHDPQHSPHPPNGLTRHNGLTKSLTMAPHTCFPHHPLFSSDDPAYKDEKKRSGSTPSREVHNKLEKNRRAHLKECFETLRRQLPSMDDKKISNQTILKAAHRHIQNLKRKEREYEHEMERLAREKIAHQQKLSALKKELSARWDHIDFKDLLPDMASLEQQRDKETKSTTTASEQPDLEEDGAPRDAGTQATVTASPSPRLQGDHHHVPPPACFATVVTEGSGGSGPVGLAPPPEPFSDPNQPLNLSTNLIDSTRASPRTQQVVGPGRSPLPSVEWHQQPQPQPQLQPQPSPHFTPATSFSGGSSEEEMWAAPEASTVTATVTRDTLTNVPSEHLPIMTSAGIHLPAQLVIGAMQLNGAPGGLLGQPAIQVITPEGYKLLPADHPNGTKPLTITRAHPGGEGLDRSEGGEEVKTAGPAMTMVALKNGMPAALHLAVPTTPRSLAHTPGSNGTITTVPLNLSVGGPPAVKVTQAATSNLLSSYVPITHANGITQLVSAAGLGSSMDTLVSGIGPPIVTPLVVSQPQRAGVPGNVTTVGGKGLKAATVVGNTSTVPLVSTQYTTSLGGLVKPVMVMSASGPAAMAGIMTGAHTMASGKP